jgi:hypothetical protein
MMKTTVNLLVLIVLVLLVSSAPASAANFVIVNGDNPGEGLNDPTLVSPVGGNPGTTLGEQRLIVLQAVADAWGARIESPVDIRMLARFNPMGSCSVLGSTGPGAAYMVFSGAPVANVYFHSAIADSITGTDQNPGNADFFIIYNSDWNTASCPGTSFYYGLDGNEPVGSEDLFPVVLHEMGHGLGFASFVSPSNGVPYFGTPGIFDYLHLRPHDGPALDRDDQSAAPGLSDERLPPRVGGPQRHRGGGEHLLSEHAARGGGDIASGHRRRVRQSPGGLRRLECRPPGGRLRARRYRFGDADRRMRGARRFHAG